jgi:hypothetical protein
MMVERTMDNGSGEVCDVTLRGAAEFLLNFYFIFIFAQTSLQQVPVDTYYR